ncbi:MAG: hypothetical protein J6K16_03715 [Alphaproteobacteria bacterium]|nr:hypothetical protein [Alphaproteobacteria bacterium]
MKKIMFALCFILCSNNAFGQVNASCTYNGIPLYGKVKVVENFEDFKVKVVNNFEDLKVKSVNHFPNSCGQWQFVNNFEDFKVKFVNNFEDFSIKFVNNFEGL